jgi:ABC-2 type transport system ATP-binding protein
VANTRYRQLSGGERQRLGFALAIVGRPEVVVLDEPTAGLDPEGRVTMRSIVAGLRDDGLAILMTSHDLSEVERLADRIVILTGGRVIDDGTPAELGARAQSALRFRLDRPIDAAGSADLAASLRASRPGATLDLDVDGDGDGARYRLTGTTPDPALVSALAAWCAANDRLIVDLRTGGGSLEDVYLELVGQAGTDS